MQNAMWLAAIFGPYLVIHSLWMLFYHDNLQKVWTSIKSTPAVFHLGAAVTLWIGLAAVNTYNVWVANLAFFVTLLGWVLVIRGVFALFVPQLFLKWMAHKHASKAWGVITLVWGLLLCWLAFGS